MALLLGCHYRRVPNAGELTSCIAANIADTVVVEVRMCILVVLCAGSVVVVWACLVAAGRADQIME